MKKLIQGYNQVTFVWPWLLAFSALSQNETEALHQSALDITVLIYKKDNLRLQERGKLKIKCLLYFLFECPSMFLFRGMGEQ